MANYLDGKVAIVTGSGRGIGAGVAKALAGEGAKVIVNDIGAALDGEGLSNTPAEQVVDEIKSFDIDTHFVFSQEVVERCIAVSYTHLTLPTKA